MCIVMPLVGVYYVALPYYRTTVGACSALKPSSTRRAQWLLKSPAARSSPAVQTIKIIIGRTEVEMKSHSGRVTVES